MKKLLLVSIFLTNFLYSQCPDSKKIPYTDGTFGDYSGCLDDFGNPSGLGSLKTEGSQKEGNWESGKLNGQGKIIFFKNNSTFTGLWENDKLIRGNYTQEDNEAKVNYKGDFEDFKFQGEGVLEITTSDYSSETKGQFFNNDLFKGESIVIQSNGLIVKSTFEMGKIVAEKRNDVNYYNSQDVIGDKEYSIVELTKKGSENEGISYLIEMEINGVKGEWIFDTGSEIFSIGQRMFKRLVSQGINYKDLNRTIKTLGVGGESSGKLIVLDKIKIGDYYLNNVVVEIANENNYSLLGMGFLNKFKEVEWSMNKKQITLYK